MKTRALVLLVAFTLAIPVTIDGQVGNLLKNKLNRVVNAGTKTVDKQINHEIDTAVQKGVVNASDKAAERVESNAQDNNSQGENEEDTGQKQGGLNLGKLMGNKVDLKYNEDYAFTSRIYMVIENYDKKDVMKMDFFMYYSATSPSVGVETKTISVEENEAAPMASSMVVDGENKCFIMLTDINGSKIGIISAVPEENTETETDTEKPAPVYTKTGNTREIAGYKCDEYAYTDAEDNTTGKVWFTKEANLKIDKQGWNNSGMSSYYGYNEFKDGVILANEAYDDKGKLVMKSETKEINPDFPYSISVKGYTLRQMKMGQDKKK